VSLVPSSSDWRARCAAVIPCFNEAETIRVVVAGVRKYLPTVLVIDDGSSDVTGAEAADAGAEVLRQPGPQGKGAALRLGWTEASRRGFEWVLSLDGDGQHAPEDIPRFFAGAEQTGATLIVGNRMNSPGKMPRQRKWVNQWLSRRLSKLAGQELPDSQCGFRLMRLAAWRGLGLKTSHFEIESEVLLDFVRAGHPVAFVPVQALYKSEQSKIHPWLDTVRWFRWWRVARHQQVRNQ
jgi:glycosyltransferase involved in cell wall biosynthesis